LAAAPSSGSSAASEDSSSWAGREIIRENPSFEV
jgi:hypothetical protein